MVSGYGQRGVGWVEGRSSMSPLWLAFVLAWRLVLWRPVGTKVTDVSPQRHTYDVGVVGGFAE